MAAKIGYRAWRKDIENAQIRPCYLITGEEDYLIRHGLRLLSQELIAPGCESLDLVKLRGTLEEDRLLAELDTVPFMSPRRLVIAYNTGLFNSKQGSQEAKLALLEKIWPRLQEGVCLCLVEESVDKRQKRKLQALEAAGGQLVEVPKEEAGALKAWLASYLAKAQIKIGREAAESLILRCDSSMSELALELNKLENYCLYSGQEVIDMQLLDLCCREDLQGNIFKLTDAVSAHRTGEALSLLDKLLKQKEAPILILFMLARHFRQLLCAQEAHSAQALAQRLKLPPFVGKRLKSQAGRFPAAQLLALCNSCFATDLAIKSSKLDERTALELLLLEAGEPA
ncbi:MAG: DNA polymerase III subunit delta [Eubacteriales bacterium]|nr:DNA polymerase III subunit delta [Eubacteriales bacterium]